MVSGGRSDDQRVVCHEILTWVESGLKYLIFRVLKIMKTSMMLLIFVKSLMLTAKKRAISMVALKMSASLWPRLSAL